MRGKPQLPAEEVERRRQLLDAEQRRIDAEAGPAETPPRGEERGALAGPTVVELFAEQVKQGIDRLLLDRLKAEWGTSLLDHDHGERPPWVPGLKHVLHSGARATMPAERGEGKTLAAIMMGAECLGAGGRVLYVDLENGPSKMADRFECVLAAHGEATRRAFHERFTYMHRVPFGALLLDDHRREQWIDLALIHDLVVIDSLPRGLSACGLSEESNPDFQQWMGRFVDPAAGDGGPAFLLLDNTGHSEKKRGRGASSKLDLVEVAYTVSGGKHVSKRRHGTLRFRRTRTREGDEAETFSVGVGAGKYGRLAVKAPEHEEPEPEQAGNNERWDAIVAFLDEPAGFTVAQVHEYIGDVSLRTIERDRDTLTAQARIERVGKSERWRKVP